MTIFHFSIRAVTVNVCWNALLRCPPSLTVPETCIKMVFPAAESIIGCASMVVRLCSVGGISAMNLAMASFPENPFPL